MTQRPSQEGTPSLPIRLAPGHLTTGVVALTALLLLAAGCGGSGYDAAQLDGTSWRLTGWSLSSLDPADFTITAEFADGRIGGLAAVNHYGGPYEIGPDSACSVGQLTSTQMASPEPAMRAEKAYLTLLAQAASCTLKNGALTLYDANGNESLSFSPASG